MSMNIKRIGGLAVSFGFLCAISIHAVEPKAYNMAPPVKENKMIKNAAPTASVVPAAASQGSMLDDFEANDWAPAMGDGATLKTSHVPGKFGKSLALEYDLKDTKQWVAVMKEIPVAGYTGKALQFWLKCSGKVNTLEVKLVDEDGTNYGYKLPTRNQEWELITIDMIDFSYWWGGNPKLDFVKQVGFAVSQIDGGAGTVYIDDLKLVPSTKKFVKTGVVDSGDSLSGWKSEGDAGTTQNLSLIPGKDKDAVILNYNLEGGNWVQLYKLVPMELTSQSVFSLWLRWTGEKNVVEIKFVDKDDSNFGKRFENLAKPGEWQEIVIPVSELAYLYGGDKELNMSYVKGIYIAVSKDKGGKGMLAIDNITLK